MARQSGWTRRYGALLLLASSVAGLITAVSAVVGEGNGIAYSGGAYLVLVSTALLLVAGLGLALYDRRWKLLTVSLIILSFLDLVGTAVAAYFLETQLLLAFMGLGLVGWLIYLLVDPATENPLPYGTAGKATR